jgi:hypothetical protein
VRGLISKLFKEGLVQKKSFSRYTISINSVNAVNDTAKTIDNTELDSVYGNNDIINSINRFTDTGGFISKSIDKNYLDCLLEENDCDNSIITDIKEKSPNKEDYDNNTITENKDNIKPIIITD